MNADFVPILAPVSGLLLSREGVAGLSAYKKRVILPHLVPMDGYETDGG